MPISPPPSLTPITPSRSPLPRNYIKTARHNQLHPPYQTLPRQASLTASHCTTILLTIIGNHQDVTHKISNKHQHFIYQIDGTVNVFMGVCGWVSSSGRMKVDGEGVGEKWKLNVESVQKWAVLRESSGCRWSGVRFADGVSDGMCWSEGVIMHISYVLLCTSNMRRVVGCGGGWKVWMYVPEQSSENSGE